MDYRLLAIDIDGTLHTSSREIPHLIPPYLKELEGRGVLVVLCTGRRLRTALPIHHSLSLSGPMILHSGALIFDPAKEERIAAYYLDAVSARGACSLIRSAGLQPLIWEDNYPGGPDLISSPDYNGFTAGYAGKHVDFVKYVSSPCEFDSAKILEVGAWARFHDLVPVEKEIEGEMGRAVTHHIAKDIIDDHSIFEVMSAQAGKWNAVLHVAKMHGIEPEQIVAVGDNYNDIDLIRNAGFGVAIGNAVESLKAVAKHVTTTNDEHGLYRALKKLFGHI
jgi:Cof subfamily protein (haloacid dehalogenase superfamily)